MLKQFHIKMGMLCWGDNEFDLNPMNIYKGKYDADLGMPKSKAESTSHTKIRKTPVHVHAIQQTQSFAGFLSFKEIEDKNMTLE